MSNQTIFIIGAGAIGKALAVFLQHAGKDVVLLRGRDEYGTGYVEDIKVEINDEVITESIKVSTINNFEVIEGIIVLTNKSYGNDQLAIKLKDKINTSPVVILQNGLHIEDIFIDHGYNFIYRAVLFATSQPLSNHSLRFKPVNSSPIGIIKGDEIQLTAITEQINNPYFEFNAELNIEPLIWTKVIVNIVFNSVCPLLETDNGIFQRDALSLRIAKRIIAECVKVARLSGVALDPVKVLNKLLQISQSSDGQFISTYLDIQHKRKTEIDTLNFAVVKIADELKLSGSVIETKLLGELVKIKSNLYAN